MAPDRVTAMVTGPAASGTVIGTTMTTASAAITAMTTTMMRTATTTMMAMMAMTTDDDGDEGDEGELPDTGAPGNLPLLALGGFLVLAGLTVVRRARE